MGVRILIVDDHSVVRTGLHGLLDSEADMEVVGEAGDGATAARLAAELSPDIVILDVGMPGMNGVEATRQILGRAPGAKVLALSVHSEQGLVSEMLRAGAAGYLLKTCDLEELLKAVRTVNAGQTHLSPEIARLVIRGYLGGKAFGTSAFSVLTERERQVLQLVTEGLQSKEIASQLHLSQKTIEMHRRNISRKLGIRSIAELTKYAIREGLTSLDP